VRPAVVFVEDFRSGKVEDNEVIQRAINFASSGAMIQFEPNKVYTVHNRILVKPFQTLNGNNATLKRADESFTFLDSVASATADSIVVDSIPPSWRLGDQLQVFTDSTEAHSNPFGDYPKLPNLITNIKKNTIYLSSPIGSSIDGTIREWPKGTTVRKVFTMLRGDSLEIRSVPFIVKNMNFDGNRKNNRLNYYWNVNSTIFTRGLGAKVEGCRFYEMPNENIVGHGFFVSNCQARNLNGSFVHFSGIDTVQQYPQKHSIISGNTLQNVCLIGTKINGHSEGAFTTSYTGGYSTIVNNRVFNCGESAIGVIVSAQNVQDGGRSEFLIQGNLFKNCRQIVYDVHFVDKETKTTTDIYITNNIFSNCGYNDWNKISGYKKIPGLKIGENSLTNETVWIY
jgi:hypothetical protein